MTKIIISGVRDDTTAQKGRYTNQEGMEIAREFVDHVLAQLGGEQFRLLAVAGSIGRNQVTSNDVDIIVAGVGRCTEDLDHPIYRAKNEFVKAGKIIDVIPVFTSRFRTGWFYQMSRRLVSDSVPLYENPKGYLSRLKGVLSKDPNHYLEVEYRASVLRSN